MNYRTAEPEREAGIVERLRYAAAMREPADMHKDPLFMESASVIEDLVSALRECVRRLEATDETDPDCPHSAPPSARAALARASVSAEV